MKFASILRELEWRGLIHQVSDPALDSSLASGVITLYGGFDPSAGSLTPGNLRQVLTLRRFQRAGHKPIAVVGGGTGLIGDPSGKEAERPLLTKEQLAENVEGIRQDLGRVLDFGAGPAGAVTVDNADWLASLNLTEFLRDVGKHFSVNMMIAKESVRARLETREQGITYAEFSYMLLQAYDFLHLFDSFGCTLQIGGSDQWGNITTGVDLIRRKRGGQAFGLTSPLVVDEGGQKVGKSEGENIWMNPGLTSPYRFFQYWINTPDAVVLPLLKSFTFLQEERIDELGKVAEVDPAGREAQRTLAREVTALVHGDVEAAGAEKASQALFGGEIRELDEATLLEVIGDAPSTVTALSRLGGAGLELVDLLVSAGLASSRSAARADLESGGVYLNNIREGDPTRKILAEDLLFGRYLLLRRGKKSYHLAKFE